MCMKSVLIARSGAVVEVYSTNRSCLLHEPSDIPPDIPSDIPDDFPDDIAADISAHIAPEFRGPFHVAPFTNSTNIRTPTMWNQYDEH